MEKEKYSIEIMQKAWCMFMSTSDLVDRIFRMKSLSRDEMARIHSLCASMTENEEPGLATRVEVFVLFYVCQPMALFKKVKFSKTIIEYTRCVMPMSVANLSRYKVDLVFLYFNDKKFCNLVRKCIKIFEEN